MGVGRVKYIYREKERGRDRERERQREININRERVKDRESKEDKRRQWYRKRIFRRNASYFQYTYG